MFKGHLPYSPASCFSISCLSSSYKFSKSSAPNDSDRKQVIQENKYKQYTKQYLISKQTVPKGSTHRYERMSVRIT
jgi:hypothetical protein